MPNEKEIFGKLENIYTLMGIIGFIGGAAVFLITWLKKKLKPILKGDGFYYGKDGKKRYCPACYETSGVKAPVIEGKCKRCQKNFFPTPVVHSVKMSSENQSLQAARKAISGTLILTVLQDVLLGGDRQG